MKKFLSVFIVALVLAFVVKWILPWWGIALAGVLAGGLSNKRFLAFFAGFLSVFLYWYSLILWGPHQKVAELSGDLFTLPAGAMPLMSAVIGGLITGIFALVGSLIFHKKPT
jgi:hypothetical protein